MLVIFFTRQSETMKYFPSNIKNSNALRSVCKYIMLYLLEQFGDPSQQLSKTFLLMSIPFVYLFGEELEYITDPNLLLTKGIDKQEVDMQVISVISLTQMMFVFIKPLIPILYNVFSRDQLFMQYDSCLNQYDEELHGVLSRIQFSAKKEIRNFNID